MKVVDACFGLTILLTFLFIPFEVHGQSQSARLEVVSSYPEINFSGSSELVSPLRCAVLGDSILVVDPKASQLVVMTLVGDELGTIGRAGDGPGELREPMDVGLVADGSMIWVLDQTHLHLYDRRGTFVRRFRNDLGAQTVGVSNDGRLYLATSASPRRDQIGVFSLTGDFLGDFGQGFSYLGTASAQYLFGQSLVECANGKVWQVATRFNELRRFDESGEFEASYEIANPVLIDNHKRNITLSGNRGPGVKMPTQMIYDLEYACGLIWVAAEASRFDKDRRSSGRLILGINMNGEVEVTYSYEGGFLYDIAIINYQNEVINAVGVDARRHQVVWLSAPPENENED